MALSVEQTDEVKDNDVYVAACTFIQRNLLANRDENLDEYYKYTHNDGNEYYILSRISKNQYDTMNGQRYYITHGTISEHIAISVTFLKVH